MQIRIPPERDETINFSPGILLMVFLDDGVATRARPPNLDALARSAIRRLFGRCILGLDRLRAEHQILDLWTKAS